MLLGHLKNFAYLCKVVLLENVIVFPNNHNLFNKIVTPNFLIRKPFSELWSSNVLGKVVIGEDLSDH